MAEPGRRRALVRGIGLVAFVLLVLMGLGVVLDLLAGLQWPFSPASQRAGVSVLAAAILLEGWGVHALWKHGRGTPNPASPPETLVTMGPYRFSRNPLYLARLLILVGAALVTGSLGILAVALALFLGVHILLLPREEARLQRRFGQAYVAYRQEVGRWITIRTRRNSPRDPGD